MEFIPPATDSYFRESIDFIFLADLARNINLPVSIDFIRSNSYGSSTLSNGAPIFSLDLKLDIQGKHVIVVEDIVDTGNMLCCLIAHLKIRGRLRYMCVLFLISRLDRRLTLSSWGMGSTIVALSKQEAMMQALHRDGESSLSLMGPRPMELSTAPHASSHTSGSNGKHRTSSLESPIRSASGIYARTLLKIVV
ncbi:hypothetical protein AgCh_038536 [Apium graveolens]